jgi:hypothetical protein
MNDMKNKILLSGLILIILLSASTTQGTSPTPANTTVTKPEQGATATITCFIGGTKQTTTVTAQTATDLQDLFERLARANAQDPASQQTRDLQDQILTYAETNDLLPQSLTATQIQTMIEHQGRRFTKADPVIMPLDNESTNKGILCNFVTTGNGVASPLIILPRLIPIIQLPIPRIYVGWKTSEGLTSIGHLITRTGTLATGEQQGFALGFWGIGFSIFLPPVCAYGLFGWAGYTQVTAEQLEFWPPNHHPTVTAVFPLNGATHVSTTTDQLQFHISDDDNDLMSYSVTTTPDIGSASANLRRGGTYAIPITGLQPATQYTWTVTVTDNKDTTTATYTFTTEGSMEGRTI